MPVGPPNPQLIAPLSEAELDELDEFLMSDVTSDETMVLSSLDGYLTALVIGPQTIMPSTWLPGIWGPSPTDAPDFQTVDEAQRVMTLIVRHMNGIAWSFQHGADDFDPMFDTFKYDGSDRERVDGEAWAYGFMRGVGLSRGAWQELYEDDKASEALFPIRLLGSGGETEDENALTETPEQREKLAEAIPAATAAIYRFWLPRRTIPDAVAARAIDPERVPKTGRNDPCPCGSGKKFKKCCGAPPTVH